MNFTTEYKQPNSLGFYGDYGGAFIPELLRPNVEALENEFNILYLQRPSEFLQKQAER